MSTNDSADSFHLAFGRGTGAGFQKGRGEAMDVSRPCLSHWHSMVCLALQTSQQSTRVTSLVTRIQSKPETGPNSAPRITANLLSSSSLGRKT